MKDIKILAIETSCDETAVAIVENGQKVLADIVASQIDIHQRFGGVVPEIASRKHIEVIAALTREAFKQAGLDYQDVDAVAVTNTPGLIGALLVGLSFAKGFAYGLQKPLIAVNHLKAHIFANFVEQSPVFPSVCLVVSGGHTSLLHMRDHHSFQVLGETRDDAAGEAFDKVARYLGLGYPGGPAIQKAAQNGQAGVYKLPRVYLDKNDFEFSFSGLKTATMNLTNQMRKQGIEPVMENVAAEFQEALTEVLTEKTIRAARVHQTKQIMVAGGVAANARLRNMLSERAAAEGLNLAMPRPALCTDNGVMVGCAAYYQYLLNDFSPLELNAYPSSEFLVNKTCG